MAKIHTGKLSVKPHNQITWLSEILSDKWKKIWKYLWVFQNRNFLRSFEELKGEFYILRSFEQAW